MTSIDYLSPSLYLNYLACPKSFYFKKANYPATHIKKHHRWLGGLIHHSVFYRYAYYNEGWHLRNNYLTNKEIYDFVIKYINAKYDLDETLQNLYLNEEIRHNERKQSINISEVYSSLEFVFKVLEKVTEKNVIKDIETMLNGTLYYYPILGFVDILLEGDQIKFVEIKNSEKFDKRNINLQVFIYSALLKQSLDLSYYPKAMLVSAKTKTYKIFEFDERDEERHFNLIKFVEESIKNNKFYRVYNDSCRYCVFRGYCNMK
ncbi:MAG: PD-(D/E)XK nuclease family protein [Candidatus Aenigmatarchaeota archaeon]